MSRIKIEDIAEEASQYNWEVVSTEYKNLDTELEFICDFGHHIFLPWKKVRNKFLCPECQKNSARPQQQIEVLPKNCKQRIIGIDQATHTTGFAVIDDGKLVCTGKYEAKGANEFERCHNIKLWLVSLITNWRPDYIGFEGIQFQETSIKDGQRRSMGITVFQALARLQGILIEATFELKIPFEICPTNTWRAALGVKGKTRTDKKRSMQLIVEKKFNIKVEDDIADAIGIAFYLSDHSRPLIKTENWE